MRHLDEEVPTRQRVKGRPAVVATAFGLGLVCVSLSVSAGRLTYQAAQHEGTTVLAAGVSSDGQARVGSNSRETSVEPVDQTADLLRAISGPGEAGGIRISERVRGELIEKLKRSGLTAEEAVEVVDTGEVPKSLHHHIRGVAKGGRALPQPITEALQYLDGKPETVGVSEGNAEEKGKRGKHAGGDGQEKGPKEGKGKHRGKKDKREGEEGSASGHGEKGGEGQSGVEALVVVPAGGAGEEHHTDDYDTGDALGDLVDSLNPFQGWSVNLYAVEQSVVTPVSESPEEVKVVVTTETSIGITVTTEITKKADEAAPTLVTQAVDSATGQELTDPITAKAPSIDAVSAVALGQLAQGIWEAKTDPKEQPVDSAEPTEQMSEGETGSETAVGSASTEAEIPAEGSEAGDGLSGEPLGDLPQHPAA
ncbi:hypothetical protein [Streptomyces sp. NPDC059009]|uniref:hypothetical protein n=1 Tax=Streptomyces sp. NPDC059009 TaxID=3346694 RepID=UPI003695BB2E